MRKKLYFNNSKNELRLIAEDVEFDVDTENDVIKLINQFCKDRNYEIPYMRSWEENNDYWFDVGSHSEFFIVTDRD